MGPVIIIGIKIILINVAVVSKNYCDRSDKMSEQYKLEPRVLELERQVAYLKGALFVFLLLLLAWSREFFGDSAATKFTSSFIN